LTVGGYIKPCLFQTNNEFKTAFGDGLDVDELKAEITECIVPDRSSEDLPQKTMFLIGDSLAGSFHAGLSYAVRGKYQMRSFRVHEPAGVLPFATSAGSSWPTQRAVYLDVVKHLFGLLKANMQPGDVFVVFQQHLTDSAVDTATGEAIDPERPVLEQLFEEVVDGLVRPANASMIVFDVWPSTLHTSGMQNISEALQLRQAIEPYVADYPGVHYISLLPYFCEGELREDRLADCSKSRHVPSTEVNAYVDNIHLNTVGSIALWPYLCNAISDVGL